MFGSALSINRSLIEPLQSRVLAPEAVEDRDVALDVAGPVPVPHLVFVFLGMEVFLAARDRGVLAELEPVIDAVGRRQGRRQRQPDAERRPAAFLQVLRQYVRRVGEEVRPEIFLAGPCVSSVRYSVNSPLVLRQVK